MEMITQVYQFGTPTEPDRFELLVVNDVPQALVRKGSAVSATPTALRLLVELLRTAVLTGAGTPDRRHRHHHEQIARLLNARTNDTSGFARKHIESVRLALSDHSPFTLVRNNRDVGYWFAGAVSVRTESAHAGAAAQSSESSPCPVQEKPLECEPAALLLPKGCPPPRNRRTFVGRGLDLQRVCDRLLSGQNSGAAARQCIVTGWPGVGKTTLASVLAYEPQLLSRFPDGVLWTSLDQSPTLLTVLGKWGRALGREHVLRAGTLEETSEILRETLAQRRVLLLVDDVWEVGHASIFQRICGDRCSLVFTTRLPRVAEGMAHGDGEIYTLEPLSLEDALLLMKQLAPNVVREYPIESRRLMQDLECLPLGIHVAALLLRKRLSRGLSIRALFDDIGTGRALMQSAAPADLAKDGMVPTVRALLQRSTDLLSPSDREGFIALGAFAPRPASFDLDAMKAVCQVDDAIPLAETLVDQGLIEPSGEGQFQMHALLVAHARTLAEQAADDGAVS